MNARRIVLTSTLAVPVLLLALASCSDSNQNPVLPSTPSSPSDPSSIGSAINDHKVRISQPTAAAVAEAEQADLAQANLSVTAFTHSDVHPRAAHDPTRSGMRIRCLDGAEFGFPPGTSDPFLPPHEHGCELNTLGGGAAIALPYSNQTRGRKVANTTRLEFYYAGGPQNGGAPRFSLFTDFCRADPDFTTTTNNTKACPGGHTDGTWDETLFIDVNGCNDGDVYVGALLLRTSPNNRSDVTCNIFETYGADGVEKTGDEHVHPNWADYLSAHPDDRFAANFGESNDFARADNFIIADVPVHYLVYRIRMTASGG